MQVVERVFLLCLSIAILVITAPTLNFLLTALFLHEHSVAVECLLNTLDALIWKAFRDSRAVGRVSIPAKTRVLGQGNRLYVVTYDRGVYKEYPFPLVVEEVEGPGVFVAVAASNDGLISLAFEHA